MGYIIEVRKTPSIPDLFRDAARHKLSEMEDYSGVRDFKSARILIEPMTFGFGAFRLLWMGVKEFDGKEYGSFYGTGRYQDKRTYVHPDWLDMDEAELMFECAQEFMKICEALRNGKIKPFKDDEITEPWNED